jgi:chemotaxis protein methyltransferase CheR
MLSPETGRAALPPAVLADIAQFIVDRIGLVFAENRRALLARGMAAAAAEAGFEEAGTYAARLLAAPVTPSELALLASHLTIGESYFFREPAGFDALRQDILPALLAERGALPPSERQLRLWSAGCATGEEPYSIAMLLELALADPDQWDISLLATDVNPDFLARARRGLYRDWSFRGVSDGLKQRFFAPHPDGGLEIAARLRRRVDFAALNLAAGGFPSAAAGKGMDVILCRNVLIYFEASQARKVVSRLIDALSPDGFLLTGTADTALPCFGEDEGLETLAPAIYRKRAARPRRADAPLPRRPKPAARPQRSGAVAMPEPADLDGLERATRDACRGRRQAEAIGLAGQWQERAPAATAPKLLLARLHADRGALSDALLWSDRAMEGNKADPAAYCLQASILIEMGRRVEAAKALNRALYLAPDFVPAHYALGVLALGEGKDRRARRHFDNALAILSERPPQEALAELDGLSVRDLIDTIRALRDSSLAGAEI